MIRVLVVEDDPVAAQAHQAYVQRVPGFRVTDVVHSGAEALRSLEHRAADLVLLDFYLPDCHGLELCRRLRAAGDPVDVIGVTSARDLATVRSAVSVGVVQYLLKPFTFATLRGKLESYARFRATVAGPGDATGQQEVDQALAVLRDTGHPVLPKGMSTATLDAVTATLRAHDEGLTAGIAATVTGLSRVTARRYLEYLVACGQAARTPRYGQVGRPELHYRWSRR